MRSDPGGHGLPVVEPETFRSVFLHGTGKPEDIVRWPFGQASDQSRLVIAAGEIERQKRVHAEWICAAREKRDGGAFWERYNCCGGRFVLEEADRPIDRALV